MIDEPTGARSHGKKSSGMVLILITVFALFIIWMIYTASQNQVVRSNSGMSGMTGMSQNTPAVSPTQMPADMPGM